MSTIPDAGSAGRFPLGAGVRLADLDVDPYPILARLRADEPVSWVPETRMWFLTRRDDIVTVLRDAGRFTTEAERSLILDTFGRHMMTTDGEVALRYRRKCLHAFRADTLARTMGPWVERRAVALLDDALSDGACELMTSVATPLAVDAALTVLGLPTSMADRIAGWYADFARALANFSGDPEVRARGKEAAAEFAEAVGEYLKSSSGEERALLAHLAGDRNDRLTDEEIVANALIILFGGIETTASMIGATVWSVLVTGWWPRFVAEPERRGDLVEEALRWQPAVQSITRHTTERVEIRGVEIPEGSVVQCMIGGANRDPLHFADPDRFEPGRPQASGHLSFGTGRHLCLGAHLARMEIAAVLDGLRTRAPTLAFDGNPPALRGYEFRRPRELRVRR